MGCRVVLVLFIDVINGGFEVVLRRLGRLLRGMGGFGRATSGVGRDDGDVATLSDSGV